MTCVTAQNVTTNVEMTSITSAVYPQNDMLYRWAGVALESGLSTLKWSSHCRDNCWFIVCHVELFLFRIHSARAEGLYVGSEWHRAFHGTTRETLMSILKTGELVRPGEKLFVINPTMVLLVIEESSAI